MSLELSIQENTAVMRLLIQALTGIVTSPATTDAPVEIDKPVGKAAPIVEKEVVKEAEPVTYEDVKKLIIELSKKDKALAVGALSHFGAAKGPELKPAQFAEFINHAKELLVA